MSGIMIAVLLLMVVLLLAGVPAAFAFFGAALIIALAGGYDVATVASAGYLEMTSTVLLTVPLILFMGIIMRRCGVSESKLKIYIPSGIAMILYAFAGGQSIAACLLASVVPVIVLTLLHKMVSKILAARAEKLQQEAEVVEEVAAKSEEAERESEVVAEAKVSDESEAVDVSEEEDEDEEQRSLVPAFIAPLIIFVGACSGIVTIAEAAAVAAIYILLMGWFFYRELDGEDLKDTLVETGTKAGCILLTAFSAMTLAWLFIMESVPQTVTESLRAISENNAVSVIFVILALVITGILTDKISGTLLLAPVLVQAIIFTGFNPVQFAVVTALSIGIGCRLVARPVKQNLMYIGLAWLPTLLLTTYIPKFSLLLPLLLGQLF